MRRINLAAALAFALGSLVVPAWAAPSPAAVAPTCQVAKGGDAPAEIPWAQQRLGFDRVHQFATGRGVTVAVVDSGLTQLHPQTRTIAITKPFNVMRPPLGGADILDCEKEGGHGTGVASVIASPQQDGFGFMGLAPDATIMPIKFLDSAAMDFGGDSPTLARGITLAVDGGADIINLSLTASDTPELRAALEHARRKDVVVVIASGNLEGDGPPETYPAEYAGEKEFDNLIAVGATDAFDQLASFSVTGDYVGVSAPGNDIVTPTQIEGYAARKGTSFAAPFVSATAALILERHPDLSAAEVVNRIKATADRPGVSVPDDGYGWGIVNPYLAVTAERDDSRILPKAQSAPPVPAPDLPDPPDHTLRDRAYAVAAGLLGAGLLFAVGSVAWRHTAERRQADSGASSSR